jgi:hypothetical protein
MVLLRFLVTGCVETDLASLRFRLGRWIEDVHDALEDFDDGRLVEGLAKPAGNDQLALGGKRRSTHAASLTRLTAVAKAILSSARPKSRSTCSKAWPSSVSPARSSNRPPCACSPVPEVDWLVRTGRDWPERRGSKRPAPVPTLAIDQLPQGRVALSWPASMPGFKVQATERRTPPTKWVALTNTVEVVGTRNTLNLDATAGNAFFRLLAE